MLTLNRLYAYPSALLRHASGPTGPRNSSRSFSSVHQIVAPGIVEITVLQKANLTQPLKNQQLYFENEAFLIKRFFLAHFRGFVVRSVYVSKSTHPRIDRTLSVRRIVLSCFRPDDRVPEIWNRSPFIKLSIPGSSKSRCSRKETKPNLSTTLL